MFVPTADQRSIWINNSCQWSSEEYKLVGVLLGLAVYNNVLLDVHLPKIMYQKLLNKIEYKYALNDLISFDYLLYEGLNKLLQFEPKEQVESVFCRYFEVEWDEYGLKRKHELIENGSQISVTHENRVLYVEKLVQWILVDSISAQFSDLYSGFCRVINPNWMLIFTAGKIFIFLLYYYLLLCLILTFFTIIIQLFIKYL